jgi:hypothetical protein
MFATQISPLSGEIVQLLKYYQLATYGEQKTGTARFPPRELRNAQLHRKLRQSPGKPHGVQCCGWRWSFMVVCQQLALAAAQF